MVSINSLWYKVSKSAVGPVFNVSSILLEVILGIPPLELQNRVITVKHYLKCVSDQPDTYQDIHLSFIRDELEARNPTVDLHLRNVFEFLEWKLKMTPQLFSSSDKDIVEQKSLTLFPLLSRQACVYSKHLMKQYTEYLWGSTLKNQLQLEGQTRIPRVSCNPIDIPIGTSREDEVKLLSMFYKNNLLNAFLFTIEKEKCTSPLCQCLEEEQTAFHILTNCTHVDEDIRENIIFLLQFGNGVASEEALIADNITLLNCSRDKTFVLQCLAAVQSSSLHLRSKITLSRRGKGLGQPKP
jgi:hypothetical protein